MDPFFFVVKGQLYQEFPSLALSIGLLEPLEAKVRRMGTDGRTLFLEPGFLEASVRAGDRAAGDVMLHCILHCILGHPWQRRGRDEALWSLACDMAAVFLQCSLSDCPMTDPVQLRVWERCRKGSPYHAPSLYQLLESGELEAGKEVCAAFLRDDHTPWGGSELHLERPARTGEGLASLWQRQQTCLRPAKRGSRPKIGSGTAGRRLELPEFAEISTRFSDLLRSFAVVQENRRINDADFSYPWYSYGMEHCDGTPLLEPLEYSEERRLQEMVIVLDTSGSCSRGLIAYFLGAVQQILCRERLFFERFHLHLLQCDCRVQEDTVLTNLEEFQYYIDHMELHGGGGTDFCPAFRHIDGLIEAGEFTRTPGVLYFSDGLGVFPKERPEYPVAFVMRKEQYDDIDFPDWAMKLVLDLD